MEGFPIEDVQAPARAAPARPSLRKAARARVLQIVHAKSAGGIQTLADSLAVGLAEHGFDVATEYLYPRAGGSAAARLGAAARVACRLLTKDYDALIAYQPTAALVVGAAGRVAGCRVRLVHQTTLPAELSPLQRRLDHWAGRLGLYTHNVANTGETLRQFAGHALPYRRALMLIEHGVAVPVPSRGRRATLSAFGVPDDGPILLNVGRLTAQKNQGTIIRALPALPRARLVIAGGGPQLAEWRDLAAALGVAARVHFLDDVEASEIADLYGAADLFVFPSTWESFGLGAVEAAMSGLPLVVSDLPVLREVLDAAGRAAAFIDCRDAAGFAAALKTALARGRPLPGAHAMQARYALSRMIDDYARLLTQALAHGE